MAPTDAMSPATQAALEAVRRLIPMRDFAGACEALRLARDKARERSDREEDIFLTSMLAPHLSQAVTMTLHCVKSSGQHRQSPQAPRFNCRSFGS